jgi:TolA-binding protein
MKKIIIGLLVFFALAASLLPGSFGDSFGGSFLGSTVANVATRPQVSGGNASNTARAAMDLANRAAQSVNQLNEQVAKMSYEINKIRSLETRIYSLEERDRRLEEENRRLEREVKDLRDFLYGSKNVIETKTVEVISKKQNDPVVDTKDVIVEKISSEVVEVEK